MFLQRLCLFLVCVSSVHVWADTITLVGDCSTLTKEDCTSSTDYYYECDGMVYMCGNWDNIKCNSYPTDNYCY